jgi:hypothetical protein
MILKLAHGLVIIRLLASAQGSAADVATAAMLSIGRCQQLRDLGWKLLLQVCCALRPIAALWFTCWSLAGCIADLAVFTPITWCHRCTMR